MKKNYKPKAKNETALKKYIKNATKKSISGLSRSNNCKCKCSRNNNIC